jgi:D-arabinose 1-dehydrogenase-like Zn-dependent alcohol dehydrogenase
VSSSVKAAVMNQPGVIELEQFPVPELEPGAVLLEMSMSGVRGTDKHISRAAPGPLEVMTFPRI